MSYRPGEVLLVPLAFTDASGSKRRPVLVVFDGGDADVLVAAVTSHAPRPPRDVALREWQAAGLRLPSVVRVDKLATVARSLIVRRMGALATGDLAEVRRALETLFSEILRQQ